MAKAIDGDDVLVNSFTIEKRLADIWREEQEKEEAAVTRAALWNVVAHAWTSEHHAFATQILGRASASVPQRTIVIHADPHGEHVMSSWISANCHIVGGGRQVCSEEVAIVASGDRVQHVPPLVASLLLPDMPVAVWWMGDLPGEQHAYVDQLLDPADRLIVDSSYFNGADDFALVCRIGEKTITAPADINWARIDEWRSATAALFDPPSMRARLRSIRNVRVTSGGDRSLGALSEGVLYVSWLIAQCGYEIPFELLSGEDSRSAGVPPPPSGTGRRDGARPAGGTPAHPGIGHVELRFADDTLATIRVERERGVVVASADGTETAVDCVTRKRTHDLEDLIVRLLKRPEADRVYVRTLRVAQDLAAKLT